MSQANAKSHIIVNSLLELLASKDQDLKREDSGCARLPDGTPGSAALHTSPAKTGTCLVRHPSQCGSANNVCQASAAMDVWHTYSSQVYVAL